MQLHQNCGKERARIFWDEKVRRQLGTPRRKRQAAQNSMKLAFRGKCGSAKIKHKKNSKLN
jgi:hypothetical protein